MNDYRQGRSSNASSSTGPTNSQVFTILDDGRIIDCPEDPENRCTIQQYNDWMNSATTLSLYDYLDNLSTIANHDDSTTTTPPPPSDNEPTVDDNYTMGNRKSRTRLPDGRHSILVDIGSRINVIGAITERAISETAAEHNFLTSYCLRQRVLNVNGVGTGSAPCTEEATIPIAVRYQDRPATTTTFRANIARGSVSDLPAILGLNSMQQKDTVLILREGREIMAIPGPGGYKIEWSPGTKLLPMVHAPSGHLVVPCDEYSTTATHARTMDDTSFITDHRVEGTSEARSSSCPPAPH